MRRNMFGEEIRDYQTAAKKAESNEKLRGAVRLAMVIVVIIYAGLAYSLCYVRPGDAEYYVSILTLALNTLLFAAVLITALVLKKRYKHYTQLMADFSKKDKPDPWVIK